MTGNISFKEAVLKDIGLVDISTIDEISETDFSNYINYKLESKKKEVEEIRTRNITLLSNIVNTCLENNGVSETTICQILGITENINNIYDNIGTGIVDVHSPVAKKRKIDNTQNLNQQERKNPMGHRRYQSEIHIVPEFNFNGNIAKTSTMSNMNQNPNPTQFTKSTLLAPLNYKHPNTNSPSINSSVAYQNINNPNSQQFQNQHYPANSQQHSLQDIYPVNYNGSNENISPYPSNSTNQSDAPIMIVYKDQQRRGLQPSTHIQSTNDSNKLKLGHRRTHSAQPFPQAYVIKPSSPTRNDQDTPMKQMNFLIHTPKHPPPQ